MSVNVIIGPHMSKVGKRSNARRVLRLTTPGKHESSRITEISIHDISVGGMLIETSGSLSVGQKISVELPQRVRIDARVSWSSGRFYGCQFAEEMPAAMVAAVLLKAARSKNPSVPPTSEAEAAVVQFSEAVRTLREKRGLNIQQLARRLQVSRQTLWYWETRQRTPKPDMLKRIAKELGVIEAELIRPTATKAAGPEIVEQCKRSLASHFGVDVNEVTITVEIQKSEGADC